METFIEDMIETTITTTEKSINPDDEWLKKIEMVMVIFRVIEVGTLKMVDH